MNSHFPSHVVHVIVSKYMRIDTHSHIPLSLCTKRIEVEWSYEDLWNWEVNIWIQEHLEQPQWLNLNMNRNNLVCSSSLVKSESTSTYLCFIPITYQSPKKALIIFFVSSCWLWAAGVRSNMTILHYCYIWDLVQSRVQGQGMHWASHKSRLSLDVWKLKVWITGTVQCNTTSVSDTRMFLSLMF